MDEKVKYLTFSIPASAHKKLKLLSLYRECSMVQLQREAIQSFLHNAPEFIKEQEAAGTPEDMGAPHEELDARGFDMGPMTL